MDHHGLSLLKATFLDWIVRRLTNFTLGIHGPRIQHKWTKLRYKKIYFYKLYKARDYARVTDTQFYFEIQIDRTIITITLKVEKIDKLYLLLKPGQVTTQRGEPLTTESKFYYLQIDMDWWTLKLNWKFGMVWTII